MALLMQDGFDHFTSVANFNLKWGAATGITAAGQAGRWPAQGSAIASLSIQGSPYNQFDASRAIGAQASTVWLGFAIKPGYFYGVINPVLIDSTADQYQIYMYMNVGGTVSVYYGNGNSPYGGVTGTLLGTTIASILTEGAWTYLELEVVFSTTTTGSVHLYVNGSPTASLAVTGVRTAYTHAFADVIGLWGSATNTTGNNIDDLYVCDTTTSYNNTQLGDVKVITTCPTTPDGRVVDWTQSGGTASEPWTCVNEANPDGDTTYVYDSSSGDIEDFTQATPGTIAGTLYGVSVNAYARKDDAGTRVLGLGVGNGSTEAFDAGHALEMTYQCYSSPLNTNPLTSSPWATSDPATLQSALKVIT